jgi:hypothetical protein
VASNGIQKPASKRGEEKEFLSHIILLIWILKVAGALTNDGSWSSIFFEGKVLTYSYQLPY